MKRRTSSRDWLPLAKSSKVSSGEPTGEAFRPEWIDFDRGIRVGNLEPHERITRILKYPLEQRHGTPFVTDRWGRGVYWQWICWLPKANRQAKPLSSAMNFGCAKLFIAADRQNRLFKSGLQVERGFASEPAGYPGSLLQDDWDWHRLVKECRKGSVLDEELRRLLHKERFFVEIGDWVHNVVLSKRSFSSAAQLRTAARRIPVDRWGGFQLYYPMQAREVRDCSGYELVKAIQAVFGEVISAMNLCMQVPLVPVKALPRIGD